MPENCLSNDETEQVHLQDGRWKWCIRVTLVLVCHWVASQLDEVFEETQREP